MLFSSPFFIFIFFPIFLALFFLARHQDKDYVLLFASLAFYFWGEPTFCLLAIASAGLDYYLCKLIARAGPQTPPAKYYVGLGILANLGLLIYFKYTDFFISTLNELLPSQHFVLFNIILPIGVSFIVFEKITYLVDVYRGVGKPAGSLLKYLNYVFLFPKLLAGPIIKYHEIEQQLHQRDLSYENTLEGFKRFIRGLLKKVLIADICAEVVNPIFALPASDLSFHYAWIGIIGFSLQIYFDFSGYSDMALGIARMLGFRLPENFNLPYISSSFTEFWRRWHISLSTWIRDYLYFPLGGNKIGTLRTYFNLWICFLLSGLWHGANWTFVIWGAYNGLFLILDRLFWTKLSSHLPKFVSVAITLPFIIVGWTIFRSSNFEQLKSYLSALFNPAQTTSAYIDITPSVTIAIFIGSFIALCSLAPQYAWLSQRYKSWKWQMPFEGMLYGVLGFIVICKIVGVAFNPFLYFRF